MKIYRIGGKAEAFKGCGMLFVEPECGSSLAPLKKRLNALAKDYTKAEIDFDINIAVLELKPLDVATAVDMFAANDPEVMVKSREIVYTKSWSRQEEADFNDLPF